MRSSLHNYLITGALLCGAAAAHAQSRPAVVELFTSQGCSSCPPADTYVGELSQRRDVLALTFHVDYWDDLGWRDRFGLPEAVERQRAYAKNLRLSSVYTPQVVIDGQDNFVGNDRASIGRALTGNRDGGVAVALAVRDGDVLVDLGAQKMQGEPSRNSISCAGSAAWADGRGRSSSTVRGWIPCRLMPPTWLSWYSPRDRHRSSGRRASRFAEVPSAADQFPPPT